MKLAWGLPTLACVLVAVGVLFTLANADVPLDEKLGNVGFLAPVVAFAVVGGLIAARHRANSVGWLCSAIAVLFGLVVATDSVASLESLTTPAREWLGAFGAAWVPAFGLMAIELPLRLADGRPLWPRYARISAPAIGVVTV